MEEFKKIVALSFIKAHEKNPLANSKTALARKISEKISKNKDEEPHRYYKTILNYFDFFFNKGKKQEPTETIINKLLGYLNFDSMDQFLKNQPSDLVYLQDVPFVDYEKEIISVDDSNGIEEGNNGNAPDTLATESGRISWKIVIIISFIFVVSILYFVIDLKQKEVKKGEMNCMIWNEDHYEKVACNETSLNISYNQNLIESFKKVELDTTMTFFKEGKPLFWYDKTGGKIEFFTKGGKHPTNDKVLRPITQTVIRKYVFGEE